MSEYSDRAAEAVGETMKSYAKAMEIWDGYASGKILDLSALDEACRDFIENSMEYVSAFREVMENDLKPIIKRCQGEKNQPEIEVVVDAGEDSTFDKEIETLSKQAVQNGPSEEVDMATRERRHEDLLRLYEGLKGNTTTMESLSKLLDGINAVKKKVNEDFMERGKKPYFEDEELSEELGKLYSKLVPSNKKSEAYIEKKVKKMDGLMEDLKRIDLEQKARDEQLEGILREREKLRQQERELRKKGKE